MTDRRTVRTMCPMNCHPTYCGMLVDVEDGRVVQVRGDRDNPDSHGFLCVRGQATIEVPYNPKRILRPLVRDRRDDPFHETTWDQALDQITGAMNAVGREAVGVWFGHGVITTGLGNQLAARFANLYGCQWWNASMVCWGLGGFGIRGTGLTETNTPADIGDHSNLVLFWGANLASQPTLGRHIARARRRGAKVIVIDIRRTEASDLADETILIRPGADTALALALAGVLVREGLTDQSYLDAHANGYAPFAERVANLSPDWAAAETGIPAERIAALAHEYAERRPACIVLGGSSIYKNAAGWQAGRAISCLPVLTGQAGLAGGGLGPRHAARSVTFGSIQADEQRAPGAYSVSEMSTMMDEIEAGHIRVLLLFGTNMLSSFADTARLARALDQLDLIVSYDLFHNDTSRRCADIVLPSTSWVEETGYKATDTHTYLMEPAIERVGEARPLYEVLGGLADRLGVQGFFPWQCIDGAIDAVIGVPGTGNASVATLRAAGGWLPFKTSPVGHESGRFTTPSGKADLWSDWLETLGLPALPVYDRPHQAGPGGAYPLIFKQGRTLTHFHGFYDHGQALPSLARVDPEPELWISPADASARSISPGAAIRVWNDRGEFFCRAKVTDRIPDGVVWCHDGWAGINRLTSAARVVPDAAAAAFPAGQASYEARVDVAPTDAPTT